MFVIFNGMLQQVGSFIKVGQGIELAFYVKNLIWFPFSNDQKMYPVCWGSHLQFDIFREPGVLCIAKKSFVRLQKLKRHQQQIQATVLTQKDDILTNQFYVIFFFFKLFQSYNLSSYCEIYKLKSLLVSKPFLNFELRKH